MNPPTCQQCGQPITGNTPGDGLCASCVWVMLHGAEHAPTVALPAGGLPAIPGHEIVEELARGGMGIVYRARQLEPQREVALKMLLPFDSERRDVRERFQVEITALADLDHPGILPLYQVGETGGRPWFTMKLAAGGSLASRLKRKRKPSDPTGAAKLIAAMADAVQHAHAHGVLHRDIKPGNILFDERGEAFLADFGLAKLVDSTANMTHTAAVLGTPCYMAPEVASQGAKLATTSSDIYGLGAVLYELITGRPPFIVEGMAALVKKIIEDEPERPSTVADHVPRDLELVCLTCLAKDPRQRYATAADVAEDLRRWGRGEPVAARRAGTAVRLWAWARRRPALAAVSAALIMTVGVASVWLAISNHQLSTALRDARESRNRADEQSEFLIGSFADSLEKMGKLSLIEEACAEAERRDQPIDDVGRKRRARLLLRWASANWAKGDGAAAVPRLGEAVDTMEALHARTPGDAEAFTLSLQARCRLAEVLAETISFDEAIRHLNTSSAIIEKPGVLALDESLRLQAEIDRTRALIYTNLKPGKAALEPAMAAVASMRAWQVRKSGDEYRALQLARALIQQGRGIFRGHSSRSENYSAILERALHVFQEARVLLGPFRTQQPVIPEVEFEYAQATGWMGAMLRRQGPEKSTEALARLTEDHQIMTRLVASDPRNWRWEYKLSNADHALSEFHRVNKKMDEAAGFRTARYDRLEFIERQAPEVREWTLSLLQARWEHGQGLLEAGDIEGARAEFDRIYSAALALVKRQPASRTAQLGWRSINFDLAEAWRHLDPPRLDETIRSYSRAIAAGEQEIAAGSAVSWWTWINGQLLRRLADAEDAKGNLKAALDANLKALQARAGAFRNGFVMAVEDPEAVASGFKNAGTTQARMELYQDSLATGEEALECFSTHRDAAGSPSHWATALRDIAKGCLAGGDGTSAPARALAARAAEVIYPHAQRGALGEDDRLLLRALQTLAGPPVPL